MGCFPPLSDETMMVRPSAHLALRRPGSQHGFIQFLVAPLVFGTAGEAKGGGEGFLLVEYFWV